MVKSGITFHALFNELIKKGDKDFTQNSLLKIVFVYLPKVVINLIKLINLVVKVRHRYNGN